MRVCAQPGCPTITHERYCIAHQRRDRRPNAVARGYDAAWDALARQTKQEEPRCRRCGQATEVADHIVPLRYGGARLERANTQGLCRRCNTAKFYEDEEKFKGNHI